jgi:hypothetical protein
VRLTSLPYANVSKPDQFTCFLLSMRHSLVPNITSHRDRNERQQSVDAVTKHFLVNLQNNCGHVICLDTPNLYLPGCTALSERNAVR